jgi:hypothetical protein
MSNIAVTNVTSTTPGKISTLNSTNTAIGAGATFTGEWEDITNYGVIL